jgi:hypothetical protein
MTDGSGAFSIAWLADPDGYRIDLVQPKGSPPSAERH